MRLSFSTRRFLKKIRDDLVGDSYAIEIPGSPIFFRTPLVMPISAVKQQYCEKYNIEIGHKVAEESGKGPEESARNFWNIVEVARNAPPARGEEQALFYFAVLGCVARLDEVGRAAPYEAEAIFCSHELSLPIG